MLQLLQHQKPVPGNGANCSNVEVVELVATTPSLDNGQTQQVPRVLLPPMLRSFRIPSLGVNCVATGNASLGVRVALKCQELPYENSKSPCRWLRTVSFPRQKQTLLGIHAFDMVTTLKKPFASIHNVPKHCFANSQTTSRNFTHCCFNHDSNATKPRGLFSNKKHQTLSQVGR